MKSLDCLTKEGITLLHNNNLLLPLIKSEFIKSVISSISIDEELKDEMLNSIYNKYDIKNEDEYEKFLKLNNVAKEEFETKNLDNLKLKNYCKENFDHKVEARFLERKNQLDNVVYSLIRHKDVYKVKEFYLRIREREADFGELATMYSEGQEKQTRGIVGPYPIGQAHPKLAEQLRNGKPGEVQPPIKIEESYIITRVESYQPAKLDKSMREKMTDELFNAWVESQVNNICAGFLKQRLENDDSDGKTI